MYAKNLGTNGSEVFIVRVFESMPERIGHRSVNQRTNYFACLAKM